MGHRYWVYVFPREDEKHGRLFFVTKIKPIKVKYQSLDLKFDYGRIF